MSHEATRRSLLAATAAALPLVAAGCKGIGALGTPPKQPRDVDVANRAIAQEVRLASGCHALLAAHPGWESVLAPIAAEHQEHLARLRARLTDLTATERAELARALRPTPAGVPDLASMRGAEQAAASWLSGQVPVVSSPSFAQLLASIAASEATHVQALAALRFPL
jgi:hypothetical protein